MDLTVTGKIGWAAKTLTTDYMDAIIDLQADCDISCQKKGSQLTVIAIIMGVAYTVIAANAIIMFIGVWFYRYRFCSFYCTFFSFFLQLIVLIVTASLLFTKYNAVCSLSTTNTYENFRWTMRDDFTMTLSLFSISWILLFVFVCFGFV